MIIEPQLSNRYTYSNGGHVNPTINEGKRTIENTAPSPPALTSRDLPGYPSAPPLFPVSLSEARTTVQP